MSGQKHLHRTVQQPLIHAWCHSSVCEHSVTHDCQNSVAFLFLLASTHGDKVQYTPRRTRSGQEADASSELQKDLARIEELTANLR